MLKLNSVSWLLDSFFVLFVILLYDEVYFASELSVPAHIKFCEKSRLG